MSTDTREADQYPAMPEPYTRQWINAPFTERLLFTEEQMRAYARAALATQPAPAEPQEQEGPALCWDCTSEQRVMGIVSRPAYICPRHRAAIATTKEQQA